MENMFARTEMLLGKDGLYLLKNSRVAIFGIGGVGGYVLESLVRAGIGNIDIFDNDTVDITNLNRQIIATQETVGRPKVAVAAERALSINPSVQIKPYEVYYSPKNSDSVDLSCYDYVVDAIDSVTSKIELILKAQGCGTPIISCMGTGNKLNPTELQVDDIYNTTICPLARVMRRELKKRGVTHLKTVYSKEDVVKPSTEENGRVPASISFVPGAAGLIIASEVVKDLLDKS